MAGLDDFDLLVELTFDIVMNEIDALALVSVVKTLFGDAEWRFCFNECAF